MTFVERIRDDLDEALQDESDMPVPGGAACDVCMRLACLLSLEVADAPRLTFGAFALDDGDVLLGIQSLATGRQLAFDIAVDGSRIKAVSIDEATQSQDYLIPLGNLDKVRQLGKWVTTDDTASCGR